MKTFLNFVLTLALGVVIGACSIGAGVRFNDEFRCMVVGEKYKVKCYNVGGCQCGCVETGSCNCKNCNEPKNCCK